MWSKGRGPQGSRVSLRWSRDRRECQGFTMRFCTCVHPQSMYNEGQERGPGTWRVRR